MKCQEIWSKNVSEFLELLENMRVKKRLFGAKKEKGGT